MRTYKTVIFLILLGAVFVLGASVSSWIKTAYWSSRIDNNFSEQAIFIGDWQGTSGTTINIRHDGKGDFHNHHYHVRGATVIIKGKRICFGFPGFERTFTIEEPPRLGDDGLWRMRLNGELFFKQSHELLVNNQNMNYSDRRHFEEGAVPDLS